MNGKIKLTFVMCALASIYWCGCSSMRSHQVVSRDEEYAAAQPGSKPSSVELKERDYDTFGRRWDTNQPPPPPPPPPPAKVGCTDPTWGIIHMTKTMPPQATLGREFMAELHLTAQACAANVVVRDAIPAGATYVRSEPEASVDGGQVVWKLGNLDSGESRTLRVWLRPDKEGTLVNCASVSADPRVCGVVVVGKPALTVTKTGPAEINLGQSATYNIVVKNVGSAVAKGVVVTDTVPDGMTESGGRKQLTFDVGDLAPGQSKTMQVTVKADQRGKICNKVAATASNGDKVEAEACSEVVKHMVAITKTTSDEMLLIGRVATYTIKVTNSGDRKETGVVVTDTAAAGTTIDEAPGASVNGNQATWNVGDLDANGTKTLTVKIRSRQAGKFCNTSHVSSAQGASASAEACTTWEGVTGVLLEMVDDPDPIAIGETSTYTIKVTNQGSSRAIEQLTIVAVIPPELELVPGSITGGGTLSGNKITWPVVPSLAAKGVVTRTYKAKGVKAGDARSLVHITTLLRQNPIEKYESTTVY